MDMVEKWQFFVLVREESTVRWLEWLAKLCGNEEPVVQLTSLPDVLPEHALLVFDAPSFYQWKTVFFQMENPFPFFVLCNQFEECRTLRKEKEKNIPVLCRKPVLKWIRHSKLPEIFRFLLPSLFEYAKKGSSSLVYAGVLHDFTCYPLFIMTKFADTFTSSDLLSFDVNAPCLKTIAELKRGNVTLHMFQADDHTYLFLRETDSVYEPERNQACFLFQVRSSFSEFFQHAPVLFFEFSRDGRITETSGKAKHKLKTYFGESLTLPSTLLHEITERLMKRNPTHIPLTPGQSDAGFIHMLSVLSLQHPLESTHYYGFIDIFPMGEYMHDLFHMPEDVISSFLDVIPLPAGVLCKDFQIHMNSRARELLNVSLKSFYISLDEFLGCVHTDDRDYAKHAFLLSLEHGGREISFQFTTTKHPRKTVECRIGVTHVERDKKIVLFFLDDVSERIMNVRRLARKEGFLSARKIIYRISHEFNNIGNLIEYVIQLVQSYPENADALHEWAQILHKEYSIARKSVSNLLVFSSIAEDRKEVFDVYLALESAVEQFEQTLPENISIKRDYERLQNLYISGSIKLFQLAIGNILENSVTYLEDGGEIEIFGEVLTPEFFQQWDFEYVMQQPYIHIVLSDTGPGMSIEKIARYIDYELSEYDDPTRLGLFQVRTIIEDLGGFFRIESRPGKGTKNHIFVPISSETEQ